MSDFLFLGHKITVDGDCSHEIKKQNKTKKKMLASWEKSYDKPRYHIKKQRYNFDNKGLYSQSYGFSSSHVQMWVLDHKEGWKWTSQVSSYFSAQSKHRSPLHLLPGAGQAA